MIDEFSKESRDKKIKTIEQLVIERPIRFYASPYSNINDSTIKVYAAKTWVNSIDKYHKYDITMLLANGYKIISVQKAFIGSGCHEYAFGVETMILEKEIYAWLNNDRLKNDKKLWSLKESLLYYIIRKN